MTRLGWNQGACTLKQTNIQSWWEPKIQIEVGVGYAVGLNQDLRVHMWCDVLCMSFGHRKQEKLLFLKNFHFRRLALPKTGENREIRDFLWFFG